jgi:ribosomal protein S18 acetylase RimI-like enzyme
MMTSDASISPSITLRPATAEDTAFLQKVFASTRDEFQMLIADEGQLAALISMQFNFQQQQYRDGYPDARDNIILLRQEPIGRVFVHENHRAVTLVDIALLPEHRKLGFGKQLLDDLLTHAASVAKPVRLHVMRTNPARKLYQRLGFQEISEDSMYYEMICEPRTSE